MRLRDFKKVVGSISLLALVVACGTGDLSDSELNIQEYSDKSMMLSKTIKLVDASGLNSAVASLYSHEQALLDELDADSLTLIPIYENSEHVEPEIPDEESAVIPFGELVVELNDEVMAPGVIALEINESRAPTYRAPFKWRYEYSSLDCANVTRTSFWHRVYTSIWYKASSGSSWSTMVSERKLSNNETVSRCRTGSYKIKVGTKARRTSHYDVEFWE